ncbi:hypothetical protein PA25_02340 [Pseudoalteromonas sp. A25]|uniref:UPF0149 family protein n=1 Tax=Pseudoalteromonas sp. A25 TaxID=116092 RepID=UPI00126078D7|nr:UPF0149 family protein [Pseudoalteromonas sp. A25]BBN80249.1 hypothetical protein PA25_02340 [Pseudoalteromonas sp. A25]
MFEFNFTPEHRQLLADYVAHRQGAMPLSMVQGYLFAAICGPDAVEVEPWLADVSCNDQAIDESVVFAYMALHHQITEQVFSGTYQLPWLNETDYGARHLWSKGFLTGVETYFESFQSSSRVTGELKEALQMATEQLAFFSLEHSQIVQFCTHQQCNERDFINQQTQLAQEFAQGYAQLIETVALQSGLYDDEQGF